MIKRAFAWAARPPPDVLHHLILLRSSQAVSFDRVIVANADVQAVQKVLPGGWRLTPNFDRDVRVGDQVVIPGRMCGAPPLEAMKTSRSPSVV